MADTPENTIQLFYDMFAEGKVKELLEACCTGDLPVLHHPDRDCTSDAHLCMLRHIHRSSTSDMRYIWCARECALDLAG